MNILTGKRSELLSWIGEHMDVNGVTASDLEVDEVRLLQQAAAGNLKRITIREEDPAKCESPYPILSTQELKTTWHPIESSLSGGSKY